MRTLNISKYHGLGNDFIMMSFDDALGLDLEKLSIKVCDRHTGIGADGLILVKENPLEMIYFNSDGSRAKMCGNGIRCFSKYCLDKGIVTSNEFLVATLAGDHHITVKGDNQFEVDMGQASFKTTDIPMLVNQDEFIDEVIQLDNVDYKLTSLLMGATHTVIEVQDLQVTDMIEIGKSVQRLEFYPKSTNVNFYEVIREDVVKMQTYERGAGLTLACGTGACSVFAVLKRKNQTLKKLNVLLPLGELVIREKDGHVLMMGPAEKVMDGMIEVAK